MRLKLISGTALLTLLLAGCGGSDGDSPTTEVTPSADLTPLSGTVVDGYIYNALVWLDLNGDQLVSEGEPQTRSELDGSYLFELEDSVLQGLPGVSVIAQLDSTSYDVGLVPPSSMDEFNAAVKEGSLVAITDNSNVTVKLTTPPFTSEELSKLTDEEGLSGKAITPFTHQIYQALAESLSSLSDSDIDAEQLQAAIDNLVANEQASQLSEYTQQLEQAGLTGLSEEALTLMLQGDFIALSDDSSAMEELSEMAQIMVKTMVEQNEHADELAQEPENAGWTVSFQSEQGTKHYIPYNMNDAVTVSYKVEITTRVNEALDTKEWTNQYWEYLDVQGEQQLFAEGKEVTTLTLSSGNFEVLGDHRSDKGINGVFHAVHIYETGSVITENGVTTEDYYLVFDEGNPVDSGGAPNYNFPERVLDYESAEELAAAYKSGDYSAIEALQHHIETTRYTEDYKLFSLTFNEFLEFDENTDFLTERADYREYRDDYSYYDGRSIYEVRKDWEADGSINEVLHSETTLEDLTIESNSNPVWGANPEYDPWYQYFNYWEEYSQTEGATDSAGNPIFSHSAKRYLLDPATNTKYVDSNGESPVFSQFAETITTLDAETRTYTSWDHFRVEDALLDDFNPTFDNSGQKYASSNYQREFVESWGRNIDDLPGLVGPLMDQALSENAIAAIVYSSSLDSYNARFFSESDCEIELTGSEATNAAFTSALAQCGEDLGFSDQEIRGARIARSRQQGEVLRVWILEEDGALVRANIGPEDTQISNKQGWFISDSGYLELQGDEDSIRRLAPYYKAEKAMGVIVMDYNPITGEVSEIWSEGYTDISDWDIPELSN